MLCLKKNFRKVEIEQKCLNNLDLLKKKFKNLEKDNNILKNLEKVEND